MKKKSLTKKKIPKRVVLNIPKEALVKAVGVNWIMEGKYAFHFNQNNGKAIHVEDGWIVQSKKSTLKYLSTYDGQVRSTHTITVEALEKLLKLAKARQEEFKDGLFFVHMSPDLTFLFQPTKKK